MKKIVRPLIRVVLVVQVVLLGVALVLGWMRADRPDKRESTVIRPSSINRSLYWSKLGELQTLDPSTGKITVFALPGRELVDSASFSPWRDERGNWQVVGRWMMRNGEEMQEAGLVRFLYPEGRILDRVETRIQPVGKPCWFPGNALRILFTAGDGRLYKLDFSDPGRAGTREDRRPRAIDWRDKLLGRESIVYDPIWLEDARIGDRLFVTLVKQRETFDRNPLPSMIAWLQLDTTRTVVVDSGRVTPSLDDNLVDEYRPSVVRTPEGELLLSYISHDEDDGSWRLHVAPITFDAETGNPKVEATEGTLLETSIKPGTPIFSPDAKWIYCALPTTSPSPRVVRISTSDLGLELVRDELESDAL